jgi:acetyl-CoA decarbonylase/synthase complex subunit gamma
MAFAMKLAAKKAEISECPYASEEAVRGLGAASEPPVRGVALGPDRSLVLGEETVLYRHEKTFFHRTALAVNVDDTAGPDEAGATLASVRDYCLERVGQIIALDMVAVTHRGSDRAAFIDLARKAREVTGLPLVVRSPDVEALEAVASVLEGNRCVLCAATPQTLERLRAAAQRYGQALAVSAPDLDGLCGAAAALREQGFQDILLQPPPGTLARQFQVNSILRRAALQDDAKPLGYPHLRFVEGGDAWDTVASAVTEIDKYGGVCVLPEFDAALLAVLMTLRLNVFTDPQKPISVEPRVYPVGEPGVDSPVFVTTNFSLTYFTVSGEIENSGVSAWLVVPECEGMSVLTAWAAGKFSGASIAKFIQESGLEQQVSTRDIVIPAMWPRSAVNSRKACRDGRSLWVPRMQGISRASSRRGGSDRQGSVGGRHEELGDSRCLGRSFNLRAFPCRSNRNGSARRGPPSGVDVEAPCGGKGTCGRCNVRVAAGRCEADRAGDSTTPSPATGGCWPARPVSAQAMWSSNW